MHPVQSTWGAAAGHLRNELLETLRPNEEVLPHAIPWKLSGRDKWKIPGTLWEATREKTEPHQSVEHAKGDFALRKWLSCTWQLWATLSEQHFWLSAPRDQG